MKLWLVQWGYCWEIKFQEKCNILIETHLDPYCTLSVIYVIPNRMTCVSWFCCYESRHSAPGYVFQSREVEE